MLNDILCDKFLLSKCIGKGTFSKILVAKCLHLDVEEDVQEDKLVAIKMQKTSASNMSVFRWEGEVLASLSGISCVPTVHYSGKYNDKYECIAMDYFSGEDMGKLRDKVKGKLGHIPLVVCAYLSKVMISSIQAIHERGYVHR